MKKVTPKIIAIMLIFPIYGNFSPAFGNPQTQSKSGQSQTEKGSTDLKKLQRELSKQNAKVVELENQLSQVLGILIPDIKNTLEAIVKAKSQSDSATIMLIDRINTLQNKIKILEDKASYSDSTNFEILTQLVMIENKIVTLTRSFNELYNLRVAASLDEKPRISSSDFKRKYVQALGYYQNNEFQKSITEFSELVLSDPDHELADNSQYWLGECYYSLKNYKRALVEFSKVLEYTDSDKRDDSQLKLGMCYMSIGNNEKAADEFQKLLDFYPDSEYFDKARQYLKQL